AVRRTTRDPRWCPVRTVLRGRRFPPAGLMPRWAAHPRTEPPDSARLGRPGALVGAGLAFSRLGNLCAGAPDAEGLHLLVEVGTLEVEEPGCLGGVVAGEGQGAEDDLPLGVVHQVAERLLSDGAERGRGLLLGAPQWSGPRGPDRTRPGEQLPGLVAGHLRALAEDGQPLDQGPELADVARG